MTLDQKLLAPISCNNATIVLRSNGQELSCGDVQRRRGSYSARGMSSPIVTPICARAKSSTAISVSLSDWLGGQKELRSDYLEDSMKSSSVIPAFEIKLRSVPRATCG